MRILFYLLFIVYFYKVKSSEQSSSNQALSSNNNDLVNNNGNAQKILALNDGASKHHRKNGHVSRVNHHRRTTVAESEEDNSQNEDESTRVLKRRPKKVRKVLRRRTLNPMQRFKNRFRRKSQGTRSTYDDSKVTKHIRKLVKGKTKSAKKGKPTGSIKSKLRALLKSKPKSTAKGKPVTKGKPIKTTKGIPKKPISTPKSITNKPKVTTHKHRTTTKSSEITTTNPKGITSTVPKKQDSYQSVKLNFLKQTNEYRKAHQSAPLKLNKTIEAKAQAYAEKMAKMDVLAHDPDNTYGENIYTSTSSPSDAVKSWYSEVELYNFALPIFSLYTGHFTAVVWNATTDTGCGVAKSATNKYYVSCKYYPPGNVMGQFGKNVFKKLT
uniref:CAP domain-containing protein (inferred by orthology to a human protein) n=1 Tax=Strongyloides venezuelensis TaxID=75913 RepID=A0A0K0G1T0_STRVS